jgi:protein involved in polysaccharide export with SLBB domain
MKRYFVLAAIVMLMGFSSFALPSTQPVDTIATHDLLCIGIWDIRPTGGESLKTVRVDGQGNVSLYYVGTVRIGGKTFAQAEKEIADAYQASGVLKTPQPSVNRLETAEGVAIKSGKIAAGEKVSIRIFDLVPDVEVSRILTISEGGKVGLPLIGQFPLAGRTEAEAEQDIARTLQEQFGLPKIPVSVLRLGPKQKSEPTTAADANGRATQQVPRTTR